MQDLNKLFEKAKKEGGVEVGFSELAKYLMNECVLEVNGEEYQLAEIEFYYFNKDKHPDVFVHCNKEQLKTNSLYFHGSGMDITFGNKDKNNFSGILIRSLIKLNNKEPIIGPYKIVTNFLHNAKKDENNKLELTIYLKEKKVFNKDPLKSVRVGLTLKETDINKKKLKEEFIFKPYRYILNDEEFIFDLLKTNEPTFLAWFIKDENFKKQNLLDRIKYLKKSLKENRQTFLNVKDPTIRKFFIENFVEK